MKNKKSLGQHWLYNRAILDEIADLAIAPETDLCIEIGPGLGTLTSSLLKRFSQVIAIEFDADLAAKLPKSFPGKNLTVIHGDILKVGAGCRHRTRILRLRDGVAFRYIIGGVI